MKWFFTILSSYYFVQVLDFFLWGAGTATEAFVFFICLIVSVWYVWDNLRKEEIENERN